MRADFGKNTRPGSDHSKHKIPLWTTEQPSPQPKIELSVVLKKPSIFSAKNTELEASLQMKQETNSRKLPWDFPVSTFFILMSISRGYENSQAAEIHRERCQVFTDDSWTHRRVFYIQIYSQAYKSDIRKWWVICSARIISFIKMLDAKLAVFKSIVACQATTSHSATKTPEHFCIWDYSQAYTTKYTWVVYAAQVKASFKLLRRAATCQARTISHPPLH